MSVVAIDLLWQIFPMSPSVLENSEAVILARVIAPQSTPISPAVAEELLKWGFSASDQERMSDLAAKARSGTLTPAESLEIEGFERVSSFLGLVKSKARQALKAASK